MEISISKLEVSKQVSERLKHHRLSLRACCELYNQRFHKEISEKKIRPLTKDFVQRIKSNNFKIISDRVSKLCELLEIDMTFSSRQNSHFSYEILRIERAVGKKPELENQLRKLLSTVADIASYGE